MSEPATVVRRRALIAAAWPHGAMVSDNTLDSYVRRIRNKLESLDLADIVTVRGVGYRWR
jgi:two-component system response regulator MprA